MNRLKSVLLLVLLGVLFTAATEPTEAADPPNVVIFFCDDLGYGDLGCYGHPHIRTPHLDRMASQGMRFTHFYSASPVCSPSRAALLTGMHPHLTGIYDWIPNSDGTARPDAREQVHLRSGFDTLPAMLRRNGYATFLCGKWHLNSRFNEPAIQPTPDQFGFDRWIAAANRAVPDHANQTNLVDNGIPLEEAGQFSSLFVASQAMQWITEHQLNNERFGKTTPFFCFLPFFEPHEPVASPELLVQQYLVDASNEDEAHYFANVASIDLAVGMVMRRLESLGVANNTLVIFTSDNGPETLNRYRGANRSYGSAGPLRGMKLDTWEGGIRVPCIAHWPDVIEAGSECDVPAWTIDFFPTLLEAIDSGNVQSFAHGQSMLGLMKGETVARKSPLVWLFLNALNKKHLAMRHGQWKVVCDLQGIENVSNVTPEFADRLKNATPGSLEVYSLVDDPGETTDVAAQYPEVTQVLRSMLEAQLRMLVNESPAWVPEK